ITARLLLSRERASLLKEQISSQRSSRYLFPLLSLRQSLSTQPIIHLALNRVAIVVLHLAIRQESSVKNCNVRKTCILAQLSHVAHVYLSRNLGFHSASVSRMRGDHSAKLI